MFFYWKYWYCRLWLECFCYVRLGLSLGQCRLELGPAQNEQIRTITGAGRTGARIYGATPQEPESPVPKVCGTITSNW